MSRFPRALTAVAVASGLFSTSLFAGIPEIVINEIMQNPAAVGDGSGEWVELYNDGPAPVDINGWTIRDDGADSGVIRGWVCPERKQNVCPGGDGGNHAGRRRANQRSCWR